MSTKHEIDHLFSNKLGGLTAAPNPASWEQLEQHLNHKKKPVWLWLGVAATVSLLLIAGINFLNIPDVEISYINPGAEVDHPQLAVEEIPQIDFSDIEIEHSLPAQHKKTNKVMQPAIDNLHLPNVNDNVPSEQTMLAEEENTMKTQEEFIDRKFDIAEGHNEVIANNVAIQMVQIDEVTLPKVTITYAPVSSKPAATIAQDSAKFSLKKVLASAKKLGSEEGLMADLRSAKDNLLTIGRHN